MEGEPPPEPSFDDLVAGSAQLAGVWANHSRVTQSDHEFTLDFIRVDHTEGVSRRQAILVARVAVSPMFIVQLMDTLATSWSVYAERSMRREVRSGDEQGTDEDTSDPRKR